MKAKIVEIKEEVFNSLIASMDPEDRFLDNRGRLVLYSNSGNVLYFSPTLILAVLDSDRG